MPHILNSRQPKPDRIPRRRKIRRRNLHIRRHHRNLHLPALADILHHVLRLRRLRSQQSRHKLHRIMRLQPRRVIRQQRIRRRVRLIKPIPRKLLHQIKQLPRRIFRMFPLQSPGHKNIPLLRHLRRILLPHSPPQKIRTPQRIPRDRRRNLHHLLLVHNHAQRLLKNHLQLRKHILHRPPPPLALDEVINHPTLNRPRPIKRIQSRQILNARRLIPPQHIPHPPRLKLKHPTRQSLMKHLLIRLRIIQRNRSHIHNIATILLNQLQAIIDHRKRRQPQKVHLEKAHLLDSLHVIASDNRLILRPGHRHQLRQRLRRNHHPRRMHPRPPHQPLEPLRRLNQLPNLRILTSRSQRWRVLQRLLNRDPNRRRNQLRNPVHLAIRHIQRAPYVLDRRLRRHRVERNDLRHLVNAILLPHVLDHFPTPVHAKVNVHVGHRHPLRIQEPLKQQIVLQRIHIRDLHHVRHQRPRRRSTPRPHRDVLLLRIPDEVPHNHEVARKLHALDALNLPRQPRLILRNRIAEYPPRLQVRHRRIPPLLPTLPANLLEVRVNRLPFRQRKLRKRVLHLREFQVAALRELHRPRAHLRRMRKQPVHLLRRLDVKLVLLKPEPLRVVHRVRRLHAQQHLMRPRIPVLDIVRIVRRHERNPQVLLQPEHRLRHRLIRLQPMILDL